MNRNIYQFGAALASGVVFGFGLSLSGMLNPARVQGFLDIFGAWDPSLAFVLGGAVVIAFVGVQVMKHMKHPIFDDSFHVPTNQRIDAPLVIGSALFGLGWGIGALSRSGGCVSVGGHSSDSIVRHRDVGRYDVA